MKSTAVKFALLLLPWTSLAQTNGAFQECHVGDIVKVSCQRPVLALGKALLTDIGSNTVTVCTPDDRFVLAQSNVVLVLAKPPVDSATPTSASPSALPSGSVPNAGAPAMPNDYAKTLESIRAAVIDPHKDEAFKEPKMVNGKWVMVVNPDSQDGQKRYDDANRYYRTTMAGIMNGSITQDDLVKKAKEVLQECDKYQKERADDPQYEQKIATLRDFVRRSEAGEKFDLGQPVQ